MRPQHSTNIVSYRAASRRHCLLPVHRLLRPAAFILWCPPPSTKNTMHRVGDKDTVDGEAQARREAGLSMELEQTRRVLPHPQKGGNSGYPFWCRAQQLEREQNLQHVDVSAASIRRWEKRIIPFRKTGNRERTMLVGMDQLNLVIFIVAHPDASLDEWPLISTMRVWIIYTGGTHCQSGWKSYASRKKRLPLKPIKLSHQRISSGFKCFGIMALLLVSKWYQDTNSLM